MENNTFKQDIKTDTTEMSIIVNLKQDYFKYLEITTKNLEEINDMFCKDNKDKINNLSDPSQIIYLMAKWQEEYTNDVMKNDRELTKVINETIGEWFQNGFDKNRIMMVLRNKLNNNNNLSPNISKKRLNEILSSIYDEYMNINGFGTRD